MSAARELAHALAVALGLDTKDLVEATLTLKPDEIPTVTAVYRIRHSDRLVFDDGGIITRVASLKLAPQADVGVTP